MIGHYLLTLSEEQEDRVLTGALTPGYGHMPEAWCLVRRVEDRYMLTERTGFGLITWFRGGTDTTGHLRRAVPIGYDTLCWRFGAPRVNAAIRNRILRNRARRILQNAPVGRWSDGTVLDPFAGSGTTLLASKRAGRRAIGIEIEERFCEQAARRLDQYQLGMGA